MDRFATRCTGSLPSSAVPSTRVGPSATGTMPSSSCSAPRCVAVWSPTFRSGCCCPVASTPHSWWHCWRSRASRSLATFSIGFDSAGGDAGDEFEFSDAVVRRFATDHHRIRIDADRLLQAVDGTVSSMSEPIMSSRRLRLLPSRPGRRRLTQGRAVRPGRRRGMGGLSLARSLGRRVRATERSTATPAAFMDRPLHELSAMLDPEWMLDEDEPRIVPRRATSHVPERRRPWTLALRHDTQITLVDEPLAARRRHVDGVRRRGAGALPRP